MDPLLSDFANQWTGHIVLDLAVGILTVGGLLLGLTLLARWAFRAAHLRE